MYALDINLLNSVISSLSTTMFGMSFLFSCMFFLSFLGCIATIVSELFEIQQNINILSETGLGLLKIKPGKLNKTQHRVLVALQDRYQGYTQADEIQDVREGHQEQTNINDYFGLNLNLHEFSLNDYRY